MSFLSLAASHTDEDLQKSLLDYFSKIGKVYVKIRRDERGNPYSFCQFEVNCTHLYTYDNIVLTLAIRTMKMPRGPFEKVEVLSLTLLAAAFVVNLQKSTEHSFSPSLIMGYLKKRKPAKPSSGLEKSSVWSSLMGNMLLREASGMAVS